MLFYDAFLTADFQSDKFCGKFVKIFKWMFAAYFEVLPQHSSGKTEKCAKNLISRGIRKRFLSSRAFTAFTVRNNIPDSTDKNSHSMNIFIYFSSEL
jgi:hypothetical protein